MFEICVHVSYEEFNGRPQKEGVFEDGCSIRVPLSVDMSRTVETAHYKITHET